MLPRNHLDRIQIAFDDHRLVANAGLILPSTLALHLGLPQLVDRHLDLGHATGRANTGDKMLPHDAGGLRVGRWRLHRRRRCVARRWDGLRSRQRSQGAIHPGHLPAQLSLGPGPPTGPGEPRVAGAGLAGRRRTRRRAIYHRPGFDDLRDLRTGQGGRPPPRLHRCTGLSPAAGRRRRHRRRADGPAARGPGQHRPRRRPFPA